MSLRRIAWDAAKEYHCLCIYVNDDARPNIGAIQELIELTRERLFLFIDNVPDRISEVRHECKTLAIMELLTVILAGRTNEWKLVPGDLQSAITAEYELATLKHEEIIQLLDLLEKHHALGRLEERSPEERIQHTRSRPLRRQLLVALHEATLGRPSKNSGARVS